MNLIFQTQKRPASGSASTSTSGQATCPTQGQADGNVSVTVAVSNPESTLSVRYLRVLAIHEA